MADNLNNFDKRTFPDIIVDNFDKDFTMVPNSVIRNPNLSMKAFRILCIIMSNKKGWKNYKKVIVRLVPEGITTVETAIKELEELNFLKRLRYRDKITKRLAGSFWVASFNQQPIKNYDEIYERLESHGYELTQQAVDKKTTSSKTLKRTTTPNQTTTYFSSAGSATCGKVTPKNINNKKNQKKSISLREKNDNYLKYAKYLSKIIKKTKNMTHTPSQLKSWANEIRKLSESNKIKRERIAKALKWYSNNAGRQYVPVIESGASFRSKFLRLEAAMERDKNPQQSQTTPVKTAYREQRKYQTDEEI